MLYNLINKSETVITTKVSSYRSYKPFLRIESNYKCVYCGIHENPLGGSDYFHVEHYKPKSIPKFESLEMDYENLFYACAICNRFKSNDWPNNPLDDHSITSYPNPSRVDYSELFKIYPDGRISGNYVASRYMIEKIFLNRPQLINERRDLLIRNKLNIVVSKCEDYSKRLMESPDPMAKELLAKLNQQIIKAIQLLVNERKIPRYDPSEIKRQ